MQALCEFSMLILNPVIFLHIAMYISCNCYLFQILFNTYPSKNMFLDLWTCHFRVGFWKWVIRMCDPSYGTSSTFTIHKKTPRCPRVKAFLSPHHPIHLSLPRYRPLPPSGASFTLLLYNLGTEKVLSLFYHVLTQQKILIHTLNLKDLTPCIEARVINGLSC